MSTKPKAHRHQALDPDVVRSQFYDASTRLEQLRRSDDPRLWPIKAALIEAIAAVDSKLDYCSTCDQYFVSRRKGNK